VAGGRRGVESQCWKGNRGVRHKREPQNQRALHLYQTQYLWTHRGRLCRCQSLHLRWRLPPYQRLLQQRTLRSYRRLYL